MPRKQISTKAQGCISAPSVPTDSNLSKKPHVQTGCETYTNFVPSPSRYDWSRHEKSLHLSLEKWICAPLGEIITDKATGKPKCVYCDELDPSKEHLATHNHSGCEEKGLESRTFYRKDHLRQHLRLVHGCKMTASMESWKSEAQYIKSRCGFCQMTFDKCREHTQRLTHLSRAWSVAQH